MPIDSRSLEPGATLHTDVCIVGAGAAGIALALELAGTGVGVALLESGGYEVEPATQELCRGSIAGRPYFPLEAARLRYFGGTTNHWSGLCHPLDPIDFEARDWVPHSGWPIDRAELTPYYERARPLCELGPDPPVLGRRRPADAPDIVPFPGDRLRTSVMSFSPPTRFGTEYRGALERAGNVRIFLHANAVELEPEREARRLRRIRFATLEGNRFEVRARYYVLAVGGIENARVLLASRSVRPRGLGNENDLVGRFFMEHPHLAGAAQWLLTDSSLYRDLYRWPDAPEGRYVDARMGVLTLPAEVARAERLLGFSADLQLSSEAQDTEAFRSLRRIVRDAGRGRVSEDLGRHVGNVLGDLESALRGAYERATGSPGDRVVLTTRSEQVPDPESRVTLTGERDALGIPRAELRWRLGEGDFASLRRGLERIATEVGRLGLGRMQLLEDEPELPWTDRVVGGWHHMGTTRMSADPARGVVDAQCRLHSVENLFVAGSSVFTTSGWANPTLTLVALAIRLADHLRRLLG